MAPLKPSLTVRSSSSAAASGTAVGSAAKAAKRVGIACDDGMQPIVDAAGQVGRGLGGQLLRRRRAVRKHLNVDAGFVHFLDAQRAEIVQPRHLLAGPAGFAAGKGLLQLLVPIMLFERDHRDNAVS